MLMATSGHGWVVTLNLTPEDAAGVGDIIPLYLLPQGNVRCAAVTNRSGFYLVCRICRPLWNPFLPLVVNLVITSFVKQLSLGVLSDMVFPIL